MNPSQLFWSRMRYYYQKQWQMIHCMIDLTIFLYIVIPFLIFLGINHYLWWQGSPGWSMAFPLPFILLILLFALTNGQILYFYEVADILFINHKPEWKRGLMKHGMFIAFLKDVVFTIAVFLYCSPLFIVRYHLAVPIVVSLCALFICTRQLFAYLYQFLNFSFNDFVLFLTYFGTKLIYTIGLIIYFKKLGMTIETSILLFILEGTLLILVIRHRYRIQNRFILDIDREHRTSSKLQKFILRQAGIKKPLLSLRRPLLFRKSRGLFRAFNSINGTAEVFIKSRLRSGQWLLFYWQMTVIGTIAIIIVPPIPMFLKIVMYIGTTSLFLYWLKNELLALYDHPFLNLVQLNRTTMHAVIRKIYRILAFPGIIIQTATLGTIINHLLGLVTFAIAGVFYTILITYIMLKFTQIDKPINDQL